jgi:hypothetical protein
VVETIAVWGREDDEAGSGDDHACDPESMRQKLWWVRHRIVAVLDPAEGGGVVQAVGIGSRRARRIQAMDYEVASAGRILVSGAPSAATR